MPVMNVSIKKSLSYLLMALFLAGSFQAAYAKIDMANGAGHSNCAEMVEMTSHHNHHDNANSKQNQHDHEKECADGQCAHSYCISPVYSAASPLPSTFPKQFNGKFALNYQLAIDNYPPSLYRPPRV